MPKATNIDTTPTNLIAFVLRARRAAAQEADPFDFVAAFEELGWQWTAARSRKAGDPPTRRSRQ